MALVPCVRCGRHVRAGEGRCPFCALAAATKSAATTLAAAVVGVGLAACYGGPSRRDNLERYDRDAYPPAAPHTTLDEELHPGPPAAPPAASSAPAAPAPAASASSAPTR
jgi:hypothetical protein